MSIFVPLISIKLVALKVEIPKLGEQINDLEAIKKLIKETMDFRHLQYATRELRKNVKLIDFLCETLSGNKCVKLGPEIPQDIKKNVRILTLLMTKQPWILQSFSRKNQNKLPLISKYCGLNYSSLLFIGDDLKKNRQFLLDQVAQIGWYYQYLPEEFKEDHEFARLAVRYDQDLVYSLAPKLLTDKDFLDSVYKKNSKKCVLLKKVAAQAIEIAKLAPIYSVPIYTISPDKFVLVHPSIWAKLTQI